MSAPLRTAAAVCGRGVVGSLVGSAVAVGLVAGQLSLAKRRIPRACTMPPPTDGTVWVAPGATRRRRVLRVAFLGDSMAAGYGVDDPAQTLPAQFAMCISAATGRPVAVRNVATVGARSRDLRDQLRMLDGRIDLAVLVVGANDITHRSSRPEAVSHLALAVHRLQAAGAAVVVGTCPDMSTVPTLVEPLRSVARFRARQLAAAQEVVVRRAGGHPVALATLGPSFLRAPDMFGPDRFHPSAAGYRLAAELIAGSAMSALLPRSTIGAA
jgi:lysophospholipase L1-like esterase